MGVRVEWYAGSDRVILMDFQENFSWDEFYGAKLEAEALIDTVEHTCALILRFPARVPPLTNALSNGRSMLSRRHSRAEQFIIVSESGFVRSLGMVLAQIAAPRARLVEVTSTLEGAETRLMETGFLEAV